MAQFYYQKVATPLISLPSRLSLGSASNLKWLVDCVDWVSSYCRVQILAFKRQMRGSRGSAIAGPGRSIDGADRSLALDDLGRLLNRL